jgi:hypothetical protein
MTASAEIASSVGEPHFLTLVGPSQRGERRSLLTLKPWSGTEWRRVVVRLDVGSEECPTWERANVILTAVQDLLKLAGGVLSDEVIDALKEHMRVVSYERFRGPPAQ